ncbi:MAG: T9SS type A sorting domain-containing protein [Paludibacteraceae bacterium]
MKKSYLFLAALAIAVNVEAESTKTYFFDFGFTNPTTEYNNSNLYDTAPFFIVDNAGVTSAITLTTTDPLFSGENSNGTTAPTGDAAIFQNNSTRDNVFGFTNWGTNGTQDRGEFTLTGLNPSNIYTFDFFGSRTSVSDNRETLFTVTGATASSVALNTSNNTSSICTASNIHPDATGKITVTITAGPNNTNASLFFYLAAMRLTENIASAVNHLQSDNVQLYYSNASVYVNNLSGNIKIYNLTGKKIAEGTTNGGKFDVQLNKGIYLVKIGSIARKMVVK